MSDSVVLTEKEIKDVLSDIDVKFRLQVYKILKNVIFSSKITKKDKDQFKTKIIKMLKNDNLPRLLTEKELDDIVSIIPLAPSTVKEIAVDNQRQIRNVIRRQLSKHRMVANKETINKLKDIIIKQFYNSSSQPGDSVGVIGAMSIGQPITQANLNTFHTSGAKNSSDEGVKFVEKLLNLSATKADDIPRNIIHFKDKNKTREELYIMGKKMKGITVGKLVKSKKLMTALPDEDIYWYNNYIAFMKIDFDYRNKQFLRLHLDTNKMFKYDISMAEIVKIIKKNSRAVGFRDTIECFASNSIMGVLDVYTSEEFARKKIQDFNQKIAKGGNIVMSDIQGQITIFLKNLLTLDDMYLRGVKNIEEFIISQPLNIMTTLTEIPVISARDLEKFSKKPYSLPIEDINNLWMIRITKYYIFFMGINEEKYIKLFEAAGIKIIENNFNSDVPNLVVLMPRDRNVKYLSTEDKKVYDRYKKLKNGKFMDSQSNKLSLDFSPKRLIEQKLDFIQDMMFFEINKKLEQKTIKSTDLEFDPIYRYAYYYHAIVSGKNIIFELYNNRAVDFAHSYPDNIRAVNDIFGIEAARFCLASKYNGGGNMKNINPMNIELLIDFQTAYGYTCSVTSTTISKQGNSILTAASFQDSLDYLKKGSAFGEVDQINGISSCIISGSLCRNGTGIVDLEYDNEYLENSDNKYEEEKQDFNEFDVEMSNIIGPCYRTATIDKEIDDIGATKRDTNPLPSPPRMKEPSKVTEILDLESIYDQGNEDDNKQDDDFYFELDIPDAPAEYEEDMMI